MRRCTQSRQRAHLSQEKAASADRHERAFAVRILHLHVGEGFDELQGLGLGPDDLVGLAAGNYKHVEVGETLDGFVEGHVALEGAGFAGDDFLGVGGELDFEGFGGWGW